MSIIIRCGLQYTHIHMNQQGCPMTLWIRGDGHLGIFVGWLGIPVILGYCARALGGSSVHVNPGCSQVPSRYLQV